MKLLSMLAFLIGTALLLSGCVIPNNHTAYIVREEMVVETGPSVMEWHYYPSPWMYYYPRHYSPVHPPHIVIVPHKDKLAPSHPPRVHVPPVRRPAPPVFRPSQPIRPPRPLK